MGVSGLTKYISENVPDTKVRVKLLEEIRDYKQKHHKKPLILIEFSCLTHMVSESFLDTLSGQRWKFHLDRAKKFVEQLAAAGADIVFFLEAPNKDEAREPWFERKTLKYLDFCQVVAELKQGNYGVLKELFKQNRVRVPSIVGMFYYQELKSIGKWVSCYDGDVDLATARYAKEHDAFMVVTNDSDFLIFDGNFRAMSFNDVNYEQMTTIETQRKKLREHLGLEAFQMPLFSTLCGNDVISRIADLKFYHRTFPYHTKFRSLAGEVKRIMPSKTTPITEVVSNVANHLHCSPAKIAASLKQYDVSPVPALKETDQLLKALYEHENHTMYISLKGLPIRLEPVFENDDNPYFQKSQLQLRMPLQRRTFGILFQHQHLENENLRCPVYTVHNKTYQERQIDPIYPEIEVPELQELIFRTDDSLDSIRQDLLKWALDMKELKVQEILELERKNFIPIVLTLCYLVKQAGLSVKIADNFMLMFQAVIDGKVPEGISCPKKLDLESFQATWLFISTQASIMDLLATIGLEARYTAFDGYYFHHLSATFDGNEKELLPIKKMRKFYVN